MTEIKKRTPSANLGGGTDHWGEGSFARVGERGRGGRTAGIDSTGRKKKTQSKKGSCKPCEELCI